MQEILDNLKAMYEVAREEYEKSKKCPLGLDEHKVLQASWELLDETLCAAEKAVEKQIAKEPKEKIYGNVKYQLCPECGRVLWGKEYYCATCGQRVNRGD